MDDGVVQVSRAAAMAANTTADEPRLQSRRELPRLEALNCVFFVRALREKSPFASTLRHGGLSRCESSRNGGRNAGSSHRYCRRGSFDPDGREHCRAADGYRDE
jgi:hypothetical protein